MRSDMFKRLREVTQVYVSLDVNGIFRDPSPSPEGLDVFSRLFARRGSHFQEEKS